MNAIRNIGKLILGLPIFFLIISLFSVNGYCAQNNSSVIANRPKTKSAQHSDNTKLNDAIKAARKSIKKNTKNSAAYIKLGWLLSKKKSFNSAAGAYKSALKINPESNEARVGIAIVMIKENKLKTAEKYLKSAIILNPNPSKAYYLLGIVYEQFKDYEKAVKQFKMSIKTYKNSENETY